MTRTIFNSSFVPVNSGASNGGTVAASVVGDDAFQTNIPIGFTFNYFGNNYSTVSASTNGWMSFFTATSSDASNLNLATTTTSLAVAPWWDDLRTDSCIYITQGAPGTQTFTIQWYARSWFGTPSNFIRFQVKLHEGVNILELLYEPITITGGNTSESASMGIKAPLSGNGNYIDAFTGSSFVSTAFLSSTTKWPSVNYRFTPGAPSPIAGGSYNVGVSQTYPNIQEAVADINHRGVSGPVTLNLTQTLYNNALVNGRNIFPVFFGPINGSSATNTITFGSLSTSTLSYDGAISGNGTNGVSTGAFGTTSEPIIGIAGSRNLFVNNLFLTTETTTATTLDRGLAIINHNAATGTQSCSISNVTVSLNRANTSSIAFESRIVTTPTVQGGANSFNSFTNVHVRNTYAGILLSGNATFPDQGNRLATSSPTLYNTIGGSNANDIGNGTTASYGIQAISQSSLTVRNNLIQNVTVTGAVTVDGINLSLLQGASFIHNNIIRTIRNLSTTSTSNITGLRASLATTGTHDLKIYNNFVSGIFSGYTGALSATRQIRGVFAPSVAGGANTQTISVDFNNVSIDGSSSPNISSVCFENATTTGPVMNTRNNVFANFTGAQTAPAVHFAYRSNTIGSYGNTGSISNFNDLYIDNATQGFIGQGAATNYVSLANWQAAMLQDANTQNCNPGFVNNGNDLHVTSPCLNSAGNSTNIGWVTVDIDNAPRGTTPDIGADEFDLCTGAVAGAITPSSYSLCIGQSTNLVATGASVAGGISYLWKTSSNINGPFIPVTVGTGSNSITYNTGTLTPGTYFFIHETTCNTASITAISNTVTVIVNALPTLSATSSNTFFCSPGGSPVTLNVNGAVNFTWSPSASLSSANGSVVTATPANSTTYNIVGVDANGCSNNTTISLNALGSPIIPSVTATPSIICVNGNSQLNAIITGTGLVNSYAFTTNSSSALIPISVANTVVPNSVDDTPMAAPALIGFPFMYNGVTYTQFSASPDGWVLLGGATAANQFNNSVISTINTPKLYPYWDDLATGLDGYVRTSLIGTAPTRTLVIEWFVTIPRALSGNANSTFQALLHEATGVVEFRYGTMGAASMSASSGLTGSATNFNCVTIASASNSSVTPNDANTAQPASGVAYIFTPPVVNISWTPSTFLNNTSIPNPLASNVTSSTLYSVTAIQNGCSASGVVNLTVSSPSISALSSNTAICVGNSATLTASGVNSYTWNPGSFTGTNIVVSPTVATTYTVDGLDANNCPAQQFVALNVNANPVLSVVGSTAVCNGNTVTLNALGADTYTWNTAATSSSISVSPTALTVYSVSGTISTTGCSNSTTHTVDVLSLPSIVLTSNTSSICIGNTVSISASGANTYTWNTSSNAANIIESPTVNTVYSVIGTSTNNCSASNTISIAVNANPTVAISGNTAVCSGNSVTLLANGADTYTWSNSVVNSSVTVSPITLTVYSVTGSNSLTGCTDSKSYTVNVLSSPSLSISASAASICFGNSTTINANGASTYTWNTSSNASSINVSPTVTTVYSVVGSSSNNCTSTGTISITVNALPTVSLTVGSPTICAGTGSIALTGSPAGGAYSGAAVSGSLLSIANAGTFTPMYTFTNSSTGCSNSATTTVIVANCTGINESAKTTGLVVYPNPNNGSFIIQTDNFETKTIEILDVTGRVVYSEVSNSNKLNVNINELANGMYQVRVSSSVGTEVIKVIKQ